MCPLTIYRRLLKFESMITGVLSSLTSLIVHKKASDRLFPVTIDERYSHMPPSFRSFASKIRNFQLRIPKKDKAEYLKLEKDEFEKIEESCIISHIGDVDYEKCDGINLYSILYVLERKTAFKNSEVGFRHLIRESIVEFGVRVTHDTKNGSMIMKLLVH